MTGHDQDVNDASSKTRRRDFLRYSGATAAAGGIAGAITGTVISTPEGANAATTPTLLPSVLQPSGNSSGITDMMNLNALIMADNIIQLAPGTFWVNNLALTDGTHIRGSGQGSTFLMLPANTNGCVVTNVNGSWPAYSTSTPTGTGNNYIGLQDLTIDGNKGAAGTATPSTA